MAVYIHLADGFEETEAITVIDLLRRAEIASETVSIRGTLNVRGSHGIEIIADILFEDADYDSCEMIVLPGGMAGTGRLAAHDGLRDKLYSFANSGRMIAAICAAPAVVLGPLGILEGRKATCYPGMEEEMKSAVKSQDKVVCDGNIITSRGVGTSIDFALAIIENLKGKEAADRISKSILAG